MRCRIIVSRNIFIQIDHIVPLAIGGSNEDENFQILSSNCRKKETTEENKLDVYKINDKMASVFNENVSKNIIKSWEV